jgi:hypothetical protein
MRYIKLGDVSEAMLLSASELTTYTLNGINLQPILKAWAVNEGIVYLVCGKFIPFAV